MSGNRRGLLSSLLAPLGILAQSQIPEFLQIPERKLSVISNGDSSLDTKRELDTTTNC